MDDQVECIDIGANLTHKSFRQDITNVIYNAKEVGVVAMVVTGASVHSSQDAAALSANYPGTLYATSGVHPHDAKSFDDNTIETLEELLRESQVVAVGECGLDFNRDFSPRDMQHACLEAHLELAAKCQLPLFLHERDAHPPFLDLMTRYRDRISAGVVHCFTGTADHARAYLDLDLHLGITGWICDERRGLHLRDVVRDIPPERLLIETDAPYLAPRDLRPKVHRNEPKHLPHILKTVAECRGESPTTLAEQILQTTKDFFRI